jgi:poly(3-hydroxyalkanoate) synthetase
LRDCYLHNRLSKGQMVLDNVRIDLKKATLPIYNLATRDDHIAPAASAYRIGRSAARRVSCSRPPLPPARELPEAQKYMHRP